MGLARAKVPAGPCLSPSALLAQTPCPSHSRDPPGEKGLFCFTCLYITYLL